MIEYTRRALATGQVGEIESPPLRRRLTNLRVVERQVHLGPLDSLEDALSVETQLRPHESLHLLLILGLSHRLGRAFGLEFYFCFAIDRHGFYEVAHLEKFHRLFFDLPFAGQTS